MKSFSEFNEDITWKRVKRVKRAPTMYVSVYIYYMYNHYTCCIRKLHNIVVHDIHTLYEINIQSKLSTPNEPTNHSFAQSFRINYKQTHLQCAI